jgi:hypothetical protein
MHFVYLMRATSFYSHPLTLGMRGEESSSVSLRTELRSYSVFFWGSKKLCFVIKRWNWSILVVRSV